MEYNIRRREKKDCKDIARVVTVSWNETYKGIISEDILDNLYKNEEKRASDAFNNFDVNDNHQFVLEVNNKIVGFINVGKTDDENYLNCGEIFAIYIEEKYHNNGFGKKLIDVGIQELKEMGFDKMIIGCLKENSSNEFYKYIGGIKVKTRIYKKLNMEENIFLFEKI